MTPPNTEKRFFFHANAVALAAHIRRTENFFVPAVASSCLPPTGGEGVANVPGQDFRGMISYKSASSRVFGDFDPPEAAVQYTNGNFGDNQLATITTAEATITGLSINVGGRIFEADTIEARMENRSDRKGAPEFRHLTANYQGLRVGNSKLSITTHTEVFDLNSTLAKLREAWQNPDFRAAHQDHFFSAAASNPDRLPEINGIAYGTIVTEVKWDGDPLPDAIVKRNSIQLPDFGHLFFGEILIEEGFRRLTLLRFQLGSPDGGDGSAVDVQSNGTGWPPQHDPNGDDGN